MKKTKIKQKLNKTQQQKKTKIVISHPMFIENISKSFV